jgi:beta-lactamase regulating signal transducer with metallopeptidase domain
MDAVLNWLWQGSVVAAVSFVLLFALQRAGANVRSAVCWAALLLIISLPALPPLSSSTTPAAAFLPAQTDAVVSLPDAWWTSTLMILALWMVWASIQLVRFVSAIVAIRRARARSRRFPPQLESGLPHWSRIRSERRATLVLSNSVTSAAVLGWGAPMIAVAPSLVRTLDPDDLDRVLIHEWAHVQRRDDVVNVLQLAVRIVAGWHPALWWIDRRLYLEREIACDEVTVAITGSPKSYAECLLKLSTLRGTPRPMQTAPAVFTSSGLRARVVKIVSPHPFIAPLWSATLAALTIVALCLTSVAVGGLTLVEATAFAPPLVSARTLTPNHASDSPAPVAPLTSDTKTARAPRRVPARSSSSSPRGAKKEQLSPVPERAPEPTAPPPPDQPKAVDATRPAAADPESAATVTLELPSVPHTDQAPQVTAEPPRSPWTAAAAGGVAIGRKSKDAGVATAGFFTRFARRVAGSF